MRFHVIEYISTNTMFPLETMQLDVLLRDLQGTRQEALDFLTLVALELEDIAQIGVLVDVTVAAEIFFQRLKDPLQIVLARDALNSRNGLATITLLATDVDLIRTLSLGFTSLGKGVERLEVVQGGHKICGGESITFLLCGDCVRGKN